VGSSLAHALAVRDRTDVIVLDRGALPETGGTSTAAPAGVFQTAPDRTRSVLAQETRALAIEHDAYREHGSLEIARTPERRDELRRRVDNATSWGVSGASLLDPEETAERAQLVDPDAIEGSYHVSTDGSLRTGRLLASLQETAQAEGVTIRGETPVTDVEIEAGAVRRVVTDAGSIEADAVVLATGAWTPALADAVGIEVPLAAGVHQFVTTGPVAAPEVAALGDHPWIQHPEAGVRAVSWDDGLGIVNYDHEPEVLDPGEVDAHTADSRTARRASGFDGARQSLETVLPALQDAAVERGHEGLIGLTADGSPVLGEHPEVDGCWIAAGIQAMHAGGAARVLADHMIDGASDVNVDDWLAARFQPHSGSPTFLREQSAATYTNATGVPEAGGIESAGKTVRESTFSRHLDELEAAFYDLRYGGWKRPMRFESNADLVADYEIPGRDGRNDSFSEITALEHLAVRDRVGMCDLTSFTTFDIEGPGALEFAQRVFSNDVDLPLGGVTYTMMLDGRGGIHGDMTVVRQAADRFHVISNSGGAGTAQLARLDRLAPADGSVHVSNRIAARCGVSVTGPNAREMLEGVVDASLSNREFPYFSATETYVGDVPVLAVRVSYVGELGWEFHTSMEYGARLWKTLWEAGEPHGVVPFGDGALVSLRLEKGYPAYGVDIHPEVTPLEADLSHTVDMDTEFVGREALVEQREAGLDRIRAMFTLEDPDAVVTPGSPILDGEATIGHLTSAEEGFSIDEFVLAGYVPPEYAEVGTTVDVMYHDERYAATVAESPLFDPQNERLRG